VVTSATLTVYEVIDPTPILSGPAAAQLTRLTPSTVAGTVPAAGIYTLRIEPTPYMRVNFGSVCLARATPWTTRLVAHAAGPFELAVPENPIALLGRGDGRPARCSGDVPTALRARLVAPA
jgi:hypothetical protein